MRPSIFKLPKKYLAQTSKSTKISELATQPSHINQQQTLQQNHSKSLHKKMFSAQESRFISLKKIGADGDNDPNLFNPLQKLRSQLQKMEDQLSNNQQFYEKKIKRIGKRYNKQCQKQIKLCEQVMELKNQIKKIGKAVRYLREIAYRNEEYMKENTNTDANVQAHSNVVNVIGHKNVRYTVNTGSQNKQIRSNRCSQERQRRRLRYFGSRSKSKNKSREVFMEYQYNKM